MLTFTQASIGVDGFLRVWSLTSLSQVAELKLQQAERCERLCCCCCTCTLSLLLTRACFGVNAARLGKTIRFQWDAEGKTIAVPGQAGEHTTALFPSLSILNCLCPPPPFADVSIVQRDSWKVISTLSCDNNAQVLLTAFSKDGEHLASVDSSYTITVWNATSGKKLSSRPNSNGNALTAIEFSPTENKLTWVSVAATAVLFGLRRLIPIPLPSWQADDVVELHTWDSVIAPVSKVAFSPEPADAATHARRSRRESAGDESAAKRPEHGFGAAARSRSIRTDAGADEDDEDDDSELDRGMLLHHISKYHSFSFTLFTLIDAARPRRLYRRRQARSAKAQVRQWWCRHGQDETADHGSGDRPHRCFCLQVTPSGALPAGAVSAVVHPCWRHPPLFGSVFHAAASAFLA